MFKHLGKTRTRKHNLQIAIALSLVAGMVNAVGYLDFHQFTTNVTGHFALFIYDLANLDFWKASKYFLYFISFLVGSFTSSFLIEIFRENKKLNVYLLPTLLECIILSSIALSSNLLQIKHHEIIICLLLFVMGLQNSFVTKISNAVVRTTHLTGLFTDLGIEISYLFFPKSHKNFSLIKSNIQMRLYIIFNFFAGALIGGYFYTELNLRLNTLFIAVGILIFCLFYDDMKIKSIKTKINDRSKLIKRRRSKLS